MKPLVSILIPAYNAQEFLAATVTSALGQTWARKEVIIVNDGSRDETLNVARKFESPSVKVITHENQGAAATRNKALSLAQGEFIQWLDADDLLGSNKIACQMEAGVRCEQQDAPFFTLGLFHVQAAQGEISPYCIVGGPGPAGVDDAQDGTQPLYADGNLACEPRTDRGRWSVEH